VFPADCPRRVARCLAGALGDHASAAATVAAANEGRHHGG